MDGETQKTEFAGAAGDKLAAALELPRQTPKAWALFAHCFSCSKDIKAAREVARALRAEGYGVLRFDFTGLGASEGDFANTNFSSNVEDLVSAADFLRAEFSAPSIIVGHSLGGAAAIVAAKKIPELKGVATIGAPSEASHVVHQLGDKRADIERDGAATVQLAGRPFNIKKQFIDDLENQEVTKAAAQLKFPLLVMHGPFDKTVGIENAGEIFSAAKHPKSFVSLDTADHLLSRTEDARYTAQVLAAWAARYIDVTPDRATPSRTPENEQALNPIMGGVVAQSVLEEPFAVALSADGHGMISDASKNDGGSALGPNPTRLVEAALAACGVMTIKMYARRKKWPLVDAHITLRQADGGDAHVARVFEKKLTVIGDLNAEQKEKLLEIADKCPVHRMLKDGVSVTSSLA